MPTFVLFQVFVCTCSNTNSFLSGTKLLNLDSSSRYDKIGYFFNSLDSNESNILLVRQW